MVVERKKHKEIEIEHSQSTNLRLVGLQVWRGALLLCDFLIHNRHQLCEKSILELGAGVGLTSITAAIFAKKVFCTDVNVGGLLNLISSNVERNKQLIRNNIDVLEYDFNSNTYTYDITTTIKLSDIVVAADVIYDDDLTDAFINVVERIFEFDSENKKVFYIALEKRYVFTVTELDAVAPCFEYFIKKTMMKEWSFHFLPIDFPQYFTYDRCSELVLIKLTKTN